jgi:hypothetical protein
VPVALHPHLTAVPVEAREHVREALGRLLARLDDLLRRQRSRGRSALGDPVRGLVIEDGEAEGLIVQLRERLAGPAGKREPRAAVGVRAASARFIGPSAGHALPLIHARRRFQLMAAEYDAVLLALAVESDSRFGRLVAYLNDHVSHSRPTVGLALAVSNDASSADNASPMRLLDRPAVRDGLLVIEGDGPVPGRSVRLHDEVVVRLLGDVSASTPRVSVRAPELGLLAKLVLDSECRRVLDAWCAMHRRGERAPILAVGGAEGSGRMTAAHACASEIGLPVVTAELGAEHEPELVRAARREVRWHGAVLALHVTDLATVCPRLLWDQIAGVDGPIVVYGTLKVAERLVANAPAPTALMQIREPDQQERAALWHRQLPPGCALDDSDVDALAARFRFGPRRVAQTIARATAASVLAPAGERRLTASAVAASCREVGAASMSELAEALPLPYEMSDLVVRDDLRRELELALAWVAHRRQVLDAWEFGARVPHRGGLCALFSGPSGTGKTMAAQVLARALGVTLYRVDLSRVLSKWIGETERNLGQLFDEAYACGCALFFDEADALFGKRSEAKDAHDRYANVEIGYLLQRMEQYDGVTILATNRPGDLDDAFLRRFQVNVQFPMPDENDRQRIWRGMFPRAASLAADVDLASIARSFDLSGGEIKNAALAAAFIAASKGSAITHAIIQRAAVRETAKAGRVVPEEILRQL